MNSTPRRAAKRPHWILRRLCLLAAVLPQPVHAATVEWIGASGDWGNPANWSTRQVPGPADDVLIERPDLSTICYSVNNILGEDAFTVRRFPGPLWPP